MVLLLTLCCWGRFLTVSEPPSAPAVLWGNRVPCSDLKIGDQKPWEPQGAEPSGHWDAPVLGM